MTYRPQTRELSPGDTVATHDVLGRVQRAVDLTLPKRPPVWRTVAGVDAVGLSIRRVHFTDGASTSTWSDLVWHRVDEASSHPSHWRH